MSQSSQCLCSLFHLLFGWDVRLMTQANPPAGDPLQSDSNNVDTWNIEVAVEEQIGVHEHLLNPTQSNRVLSSDEDPFHMKSTPPPTSCTNMDMQCASHLFEGSQDACNSSPFPLHEIKPHESTITIGNRKTAATVEIIPLPLFVHSDTSCLPNSVDRQSTLAGAPTSMSLRDAIPACPMQVTFQHQPNSVLSTGKPPLQSVAPVPQTDGSHESDEDKPCQKPVTDGSLTVWPDGTISFRDPAMMEFDFGGNFEHSETPSPSYHEILQQGGLQKHFSHPSKGTY
ncbi:hypothetical protein EDC04DRAFT_2604208 [Pisolithus marmoratus]|nr:hypothetical protein EDC04DRAFT_2604208 [Pisolithus marmoratus]